MIIEQNFWFLLKTDLIHREKVSFYFLKLIGYKQGIFRAVLILQGKNNQNLKIKKWREIKNGKNYRIL